MSFNVYEIGADGNIRERRQKEKEIENSILAYLNSIPECFAWKNQGVGIYDPTKKTYRRSKNKYHVKGVSDILGFYRDKFFAIEVKREGNYPSIDQEEFIKRVRKHKHIAFVAYSVDDVIKALFNCSLHK